MPNLSAEDIRVLIKALRRYRLWLQTDADGDETTIRKLIKATEALEGKLIQ